jgi:phosphopantothenoylcysteine synthetase/decarboxylase
MLAGKKILIGITGSIAAYKSILLVRSLVKAGAEVKVVLTPAAKILYRRWYCQRFQRTRSQWNWQRAMNGPTM